MIKNILIILKKIILPIFVLLMLLLSLRGIMGNPTNTTLNSDTFKLNGPFELSPERGRFALTYSLVEDKSLIFSIPVARFATPDLGFWKGNYVSLFAPGVSLITIPGYMIGKLFGASQAGAFAIIALFALGNFILIKKLSEGFGATTYAATLGGVVFLFATPAFSYAINLYEHHISVFFILLGIYFLSKKRRNWIDLFLIWFLCATSIVVDYPNVFLMAPIGLAALLDLVNIEKFTNAIKIKIKPLILLTFLGMVLPLVVFTSINYYSYGSPFRLAGSIPYIAQLNREGKPVIPKNSAIKSLAELSDLGEQSVINFFQTRNLLNGFYIHFLSPDRGIIYYAPVILFGIAGIIVSYKKREKHLALLLSIIGVDVLLYSMWGDPWGGWAFGSRYLIPTYAIMAIFVAIALTKYGKKWIFIVPFGITLCYSLAVNTLGAITTSALPPQVQVLALEKLSGTIQRYTYQRNWEFLLAGHSKSFVFQTWLSDLMTPLEYFYMLTTSIILVALGNITALLLENKSIRATIVQRCILSFLHYKKRFSLLVNRNNNEE